MLNQKTLLICVCLAAVTLIAFWQVSNCDFINYDDNEYVTQNAFVQRGLSWEGIRWAFSSGHAANWHPLTWLSHMLDFQLFGLKPGWHHLMNLLFHIANTLLLFLVLQWMTKALWQSAFVAALFALHPLHVESVAWAAERKDVLSTFFWMLTVGAYCYYVERPGIGRYMFVLLFFALGLMAKPMLVTLPFVLLLLDYWPLGRFEQSKPDQVPQMPPVRPNRKSRKRKEGIKSAVAEIKLQGLTDSKINPGPVRHLIWEKIPLFALSAISSVVTYLVQQASGAVQSVEFFPLGSRAANALVSYVVYIGKMIWPSNLAVFYPFPKQWQVWAILGAALVISAVSFFVIRAAKRWRYPAVGWFWYLGTLVPVIGLVQAGVQSRADRYTYIPLIGLFIIVSWGIPELLEKWRHRKRVLAGAAALVLLCLAIVTWKQVGFLENNFTLYGCALGVTENNYLACYNRGKAYLDLGNPREAILDFDGAIDILPEFDQAYYNRGNAYARLGDYSRSILDYNRAIEINPQYAIAYHNRAASYERLGNPAQAHADLTAAARLGDRDARNILRMREIVY